MDIFIISKWCGWQLHERCDEAETCECGCHGGGEAKSDRENMSGW